MRGADAAAKSPNSRSIPRWKSLLAVTKRPVRSLTRRYWIMSRYRHARRAADGISARRHDWPAEQPGT